MVSQTVQTIIAVPFLLFIPGFMVSLVFFDLGKIDLIERLALSLGLSLAVVPLAVFYLNLAGIRISQTSVALTVVGITVTSALAIFFKRHRTKKA